MYDSTHALYHTAALVMPSRDRNRKPSTDFFICGMGPKLHEDISLASTYGRCFNNFHPIASHRESFIFDDGRGWTDLFARFVL